MRCCLLLGAIYAFFALAFATPQPQFVTVTFIEVSTIINGQTANSTVASTLTNPIAYISSLVASLLLPATLTSEFSALPASIVSQLEGVNGFSGYFSAVTIADDKSLLPTLGSSAYAWLTSQAAQANSLLPEILGLGGVALSNYMSSLSSALESPSITTFISVSTTVNTATVLATRPFLIPSPDFERKGRLSTGEKIGIGIGIPAFVIAVAAIAYFLFRIHKNRNANNKIEMFERQVSVVRPTPPRPTPLVPRDEHYLNSRSSRHHLMALDDSEDGFRSWRLEERSRPSNRPRRRSTDGPDPFASPAQSHRHAVVANVGVLRSPEIDRSTAAYDADDEKDDSQMEAIEMSATPIPEERQQKILDGQKQEGEIASESETHADNSSLYSAQEDLAPDLALANGAKKVGLAK